MTPKGGVGMEWIKGKPPEFGDERVWIVFEVPTLFSKESVLYRTAVWLGRSWSTREVERATRWALLLF